MSYYREESRRLRGFFKNRILKPQTEEEKKMITMAEWIKQQREMKMGLAHDTALSINKGKALALDDMLRIVMKMDSIPAIRGYVHSQIEVIKQTEEALIKKFKGE